MKTFVKLMTLIVLFSLVVSCGGTPATTVAPPPPTVKPGDTPVPATEVPLSADEQWLKDNQLGPYFTLDQDWAAIEAAAKLEGKVTVYAGTSRIEDQIAIWNTVYPDIILDGYDTDDIAIKMTAEHDAANVIGDVWFEGDFMSLYGEMYPNGILVPFIPAEYADVLPWSEEQPFAIQRMGGDVWMYNRALNPDGCPITSWWDIVDGTWTKSIFYEDPMSESDKISLLVTVIKHGDEMAAAYLDKNGVEWTTDVDYDAATTLNAGWLWVKKFAMASNKVYIDGGDEIADAIGNLTMTEDKGIGNNSFSKLRLTLDGEVNQWWCEGLKPVVGTSGPTHLAIAMNAPHVNAAKLYIRFALSEVGAAPWLVYGDWSARSDVPASEGAPEFADVNLWPDDGQLMWEIGSQVRDFWTLNLGQ
jgi:ABC-type Fe3+ transport system substrate-binding protein